MGVYVLFVPNKGYRSCQAVDTLWSSYGSLVDSQEVQPLTQRPSYSLRMVQRLVVLSGSHDISPKYSSIVLLYKCLLQREFFL